MKTPQIVCENNMTKDEEYEDYDDIDFSTEAFDVDESMKQEWGNMLSNKDAADMAFSRHKPLPLEYYLVGGAVRDIVNQDQVISKIVELSDYDFVVVGSNPEEMISLGFEQVGSSFPVFLHPETRDEFALARNKVDGKITWEGGTLKSDLLLRDFKVNSMAMDRDGNIIHFFEDSFVENFNYVNNLKLTYEDSLEDDPLRLMRACRLAGKLGGHNYYPNIPIDKLTPSFIEKSKSIPKERIIKELYKIADSHNNTINKFIIRYAEITKELRMMNINLYGMKFNNTEHRQDAFMYNNQEFNLGLMLFYNIFPILGQDKKVVKVANIIKLAHIINGLYTIEFAPDETIYDIMCKVSETRGCRDIIEKYANLIFGENKDHKWTLLKSIIEAFDKTKFNDDTSVHINERVKQFKQDKESNVRKAIDAFFVIRKLEG